MNDPLMSDRNGHKVSPILLEPHSPDIVVVIPRIDDLSLYFKYHKRYKRSDEMIQNMKIKLERSAKVLELTMKS